MRTYLLRMTDDSDFAPLSILKIGECRHDEIKRGMVKITEPFIDEEAANGKTACGKRSQSEGERQADHECLAA